jgi:hypothetical protein
VHQQKLVFHARLPHECALYIVAESFQDYLGQLHQKQPKAKMGLRIKIYVSKCKTNELFNIYFAVTQLPQSTRKEINLRRKQRNYLHKNRKLEANFTNSVYILPLCDTFTAKLVAICPDRSNLCSRNFGSRCMCIIASPVTQGNETCHEGAGCCHVQASKHSHAAWGVAGIPVKAYIEIRAVGPMHRERQ